MNKQRLMELAGLSSNMSNPSHEPATDVPDNKLEVPAHADMGEEGETDTLERIREEAQKGVDNPEEAARCCQVILGLMDEEDMGGEEDLDREERF